jgi:hypothetical protein
MAKRKTSTTAANPATPTSPTSPASPAPEPKQGKTLVLKEYAGIAKTEMGWTAIVDGDFYEVAHGQTITLKLS